MARNSYLMERQAAPTDPKYLSDVSEFHYRALLSTREPIAGRWCDMAFSYSGDLRISEEELNNKEKFKQADFRAVRPQLDIALSLGFSGK